ncbi:MAG: hypothetical protein K6G22_09075 [Lachnospiraceae bacterium]|nr:hypothetical protein [Lachnospiraceae bacterium]
MSDYYLSKLSPDEAKGYQEVVKGLTLGSERIKVHDIADMQTLDKIVDAVRYDRTELFYVDFTRFSRCVSNDSSDYIPVYIYGYSERIEKKAAIEKKAEEIIRELKRSSAQSVYEKCLWLHNYLVRNCTYDDEAIKEGADIKSAYTIEGVFLKNTAVCAGIARAYSYLCGMVGIEALVARGRSIRPGCTDYGRHAWNIVLAGNDAIQTDVTWDMCITQKDGPVRYDYFFLPDIEMMRNHQYVGYPPCSNREINMYSKMNAFFTSKEQIKDYIDKILEKKRGQKRIFIQFKMKKRKETKDEIKELVMDHIMERIHRSFTSSCGYNEIQSVFLFDITIK